MIAFRAVGPRITIAEIPNVEDRVIGTSAGLCAKCGDDRIWVPNGNGPPKSRCKKCISAYNAILYKETADAQRARAAKRYRENPEAAREYAKRWRAKNPEKVLEYHQKDYAINKESLRAAKAKYRSTINGRARELVDNARVRARESNLSFSITYEWVVAALKHGRCEKTSKPFVLDQKGRHPFSPSLDQKIPGEGYTISNAQVVCAMYNIAKNEHSEEDVVLMAHALLQANGYRITAPNAIEDLDDET